MSDESDHPVAKNAKLSSSLDQLKDYTVVVADTGDFEGGLSSYAATPPAISDRIYVAPAL